MKNKDIKKIFLEYLQLEKKHELIKNIAFFGSIILTIITFNIFETKSLEYRFMFSILILILFIFNLKNYYSILNMIKTNDSIISNSLKQNLNKEYISNHIFFIIICILFFLNFKFTNYLCLFLLFVFIIQNLMFTLFFKKNKILFNILISSKKYDKDSFK